MQLVLVVEQEWATASCELWLVTVYVIESPLEGAVHDTVADEFPPDAWTDVGAAGMTYGDVADVEDAGPVPSEEVAVTLKL